MNSTEIYLNEEQLQKILYLTLINYNNLYSVVYIDVKMFKEEIANQLEKSFINNILANKPSLSQEYNEFKNLYIEDNTTTKNSLVYQKLPAIFANKISVSDIVPAIFSIGTKNVSTWVQNDRLKLLKSINETDRSLTYYLHEYITENNKNDNKTNKVKNDLVLADFYFQAIRSKRIDKNRIKKEEILNNIKNFNITESQPLYCKKKINAYVSVFKCDQKLYDFIIEDMGHILKKNATINNMMEEKIKRFPEEIIDQFSELNTYGMFSSKASYKYEFKLNREWLIANYKLKEKVANDLRLNIYNSLFEHLKENYSISEKSYSYRDILEVSSEDKKVIDDIKDLVKKLFKVMPNYIEDYLKENKNITYPFQQVKKDFKNFIENFDKIVRTKERLEEELSTKKEIKNKKMKI